MLISVTIPVYNSPEGLKLSLTSLMKQSFTNWEAIVVDDGSDINLKPIIDQFNDSRIVFHRFEENKGRPYARQKTFELLNGDFCAFLDAGDSYDPLYLENAVELFRAESLLGVSQSMTIVFDNEIYNSNYDNSFFNVRDSQFSRMSFASTIFDSKVCENYVFNEKLKFSQDKHFLNFVASNHQGKIRIINTHGYIYNHGNTVSVSTTYKKYYYDLVRLLDEKKYISSLKAIPKLIVFPLVHFCLGYKKILKIRFIKR